MRITTLEQAVKELFFTRFQPGADWFTAQLYHLFDKADAYNRACLTDGFPFEGQAWNLWYYAENEREFFKSYGFDPAEYRHGPMGLEKVKVSEPTTLEDLGEALNPEYFNKEDVK